MNLRQPRPRRNDTEHPRHLPRHLIGQFTIDTRLKTVAGAIAAVANPSWRFCDVGSDHAKLLASLLRAGNIKHGIAIENKKLPLHNSMQALRGLHADVRFGDGLEPIAAGECDGVSICGMGGRSIISILNQDPKRVPNWIFLQPNKDIEQVREWAFNQGFLLQQEFLTSKLFNILVYQVGQVGTRPQSTQSNAPVGANTRATIETMPDPAYESLDLEAAFLFGPMLLRRRDPRLFARLREEQVYLRNLERRSARFQARYDAIGRVLDATND